MKKILIAMAIAFISFNTYAKNFICPFTDSFYISAPSGYRISSLASDGNIDVEDVGSLIFATHCKDSSSRQSGKAFVTISSGNRDMCTLHIIDGPYEMNPTINFVSCVGRLKFIGTEHIWGTYNYKLMFEH